MCLLFRWKRAKLHQKTRRHQALSFVFCKSQKEQIMASIKIVASDLFVKSAHFFWGFSLPFAFCFLGLKTVMKQREWYVSINWKAKKKKEEERRLGEKSDSGDQRLMTCQHAEKKHYFLACENRLWVARKGLCVFHVWPRSAFGSSLKSKYIVAYTNCPSLTICWF